MRARVRVSHVQGPCPLSWTTSVTHRLFGPRLGSLPHNLRLSETDPLVTSALSRPSKASFAPLPMVVQQSEDKSSGPMVLPGSVTPKTWVQEFSSLLSEGKQSLPPQDMPIFGY